MSKFVRYGGLSRVKQKGFSGKSDDSRSFGGFHVPPARKGIYAFPEHHIEIFLLGGFYNNTHKYEFLKDRWGNTIHNRHPGWKLYSKQEKYWWIERGEWPDSPGEDSDDFDYESHRKVYLAKLVKPRKFEYTGNLWHHLDVPPGDIIKKHGSWVYTTHAVWAKSFRKTIREQSLNHDFSKHQSVYGRDVYSKDHLEVFISDKVN